jgi:hypothetical protein
MRDAFHQGFAKQLNVELTKAKPEFQDQIAAFANVDWSREVRDIVIAGGTGEQAPTLAIVRTSLDPARMLALQAFTGSAANYGGVPMLVSSKPGSGAIAFLENSIVIAGPLNDVKSAIDRRGQHHVLPAALAAQVARYSGYDLWGAQSGTFRRILAGPAMRSPQAAQLNQYFEKLASLNGGLRFSPDFDLTADIEARTEKDAAEMAQGLSWLKNTVHAQANGARPGGPGPENLKYQVSGKHIRLSVHVPEEQVRAGLQQMRAAQPSRAVAVRREMPQVDPPSSGLPPPAAGTIRVQSSEMGTVVIPVDKPK